MRGIAAAISAGIFSTTIISTTGLAADLKRPVTKAAAPAPFSWTGFYIGGHAGWGWGDTGASVAASPATFFDTHTSNPLGGDGVVGGFQAGYNWHFAPNWLIGIEADISGTGINDRTFAMRAPVNGSPNGWHDVSRAIDWVASLRGRVGYTWDRSMLYLTGGFAWAGIKGDALTNDDSGFPYPASVSETVSGWTIGGGWEWAFAPNWSARVEYLYYDLDGFSGPPQVNDLNPGASAITTWGGSELHVVRLGANYRFGDNGSSAYAADPRMTVKAPAASAPVSWTGFYVGGHVGHGWAATDASSVPEVAMIDPKYFRFSDGGVIGGGQIGYNWQFAPNWLIGIEADMSATGIGDNLFTQMTTFGGIPANGSFTISREIDWVASLRGRVGTTWDRAMIYLTGGFAWADIKANATIHQTTLLFSESFSDIVSGWTIGGGTEWAFAPNWSARAEYLYYDLGGIQTQVLTNPFFPPGNSHTANLGGTELHVVRVGVNYRFGD